MTALEASILLTIVVVVAIVLYGLRGDHRERGVVPAIIVVPSSMPVPANESSTADDTVSNNSAALPATESGVAPPAPPESKYRDSPGG